MDQIVMITPKHSKIWHLMIFFDSYKIIFSFRRKHSLGLKIIVNNNSRCYSFFIFFVRRKALTVIFVPVYYSDAQYKDF